MTVRVRFAPSPTGTLHIGSARTALFNWLFARNRGGVYIVRIEDTDRARTKPELLSGIMEDLEWMGLVSDEEPVHQSKRTARYQESAQKLLSSDRAYREKDAAKGEAVKFRVVRETIRVRDSVHGEVLFDNELLDDFVLIKSDGTPSYNFACVVDDHEMGITHVIRGDDHLPNTPKQVALYQALGWEPPQFAHIPLILAGEAAAGRLSKRKGAEGISRYREMGFIPDGLVNAMALLGFSPGPNQEVVSREELVRAFALERINKKSSRFDFDKMVWVNAQHLKGLSLDRLTELVIPFIERAHGAAAVSDRGAVQKIVRLFRGRIKTLGELAEFADFCFVDQPVVSEEAAPLLSDPKVKTVFQAIIPALEKTEPFDEANVEKALRAVAGELGLKGKDIIHPTRAAVTGKKVSPGLFEVIALLGRERTLSRLRKAAVSS